MTGLARPKKEETEPSDGSTPAASLQEKGSLIQAEERATGVLLMLPWLYTHALCSLD